MKKLFLSILILMLAGMLAAQTYNHCMVYDYYDQDVKRQSYVEFEKGRIDTTRDYSDPELSKLLSC